MAPGQGFEPWTNGLTVHCSTAELPRNIFFYKFSSPKTLQLLFSFQRFRPTNNDLLINQFPFARESRSITREDMLIMHLYSTLKVLGLADV